MNDFTPEIALAGGEWSEAEVEGNRTIVRVRAPDPLLASIKLRFIELSETEAQQAWTPTRMKPAYDAAGDRLVFLPGERRPTTSLASLVTRIPASTPSVELLGLSALWASVGFGLGWRLPTEVILEAVRLGWTPTDVLSKYGDPIRWTLLAALGISGGAFPTTGVLDTFTGADANPIGGNWTTFGGFNAVQRLGNTLAATVNAALNGAYWNLADFGPDSEAFITVATALLADADCNVVVKGNDEDVASGIELYGASMLEAPTDSTDIFEYINSVYTPIGASISQEFSNGDALGIEATGSPTVTLKAFRKPSGGSWGQIGTNRTDTTLTGTGRIGVILGDTTGRLDDFGGGTVQAGASITPLVGAGALAGTGSVMGLGLPTKSAVRGQT